MSACMRSIGLTSGAWARVEFLMLAVSVSSSVAKIMPSACLNSESRRRLWRSQRFRQRPVKLPSSPVHPGPRQRLDQRVQHRSAATRQHLADRVQPSTIPLERSGLRRLRRHLQPALSKLPGFPQPLVRGEGEGIRYERRGRAMAQTEAGYRRKWKKWLAIYLAVAVVVYLIVFLVFFSHGGGGGGYGY